MFKNIQNGGILSLFENQNIYKFKRAYIQQENLSTIFDNMITNDKTNEKFQLEVKFSTHLLKHLDELDNYESKLKGFYETTKNLSESSRNIDMKNLGAWTDVIKDNLIQMNLLVSDFKVNNGTINQIIKHGIKIKYLNFKQFVNGSYYINLIHISKGPYKPDVLPLYAEEYEKNYQDLLKAIEKQTKSIEQKKTKDKILQKEESDARSESEASEASAKLAKSEKEKEICENFIIKNAKEYDTTSDIEKDTYIKNFNIFLVKCNISEIYRPSIISLRDDNDKYKKFIKNKNIKHLLPAKSTVVAKSTDVSIEEDSAKSNGKGKTKKVKIIAKNNGKTKKVKSKSNRKFKNKSLKNK